MRPSASLRTMAFALGIISFVAACGDAPTQPITPSLVLSSANLTVVEGGTVTFTLGLSAPLPLDGALRLTLADDSVATISPQVITFVAGDTAPKTITVSARQDDNVANNTTAVTIAADGVTPGSLNLAITDDDVQALVVSTTAVAMTEGGTATVAVHLAFQPSDVTTATIDPGDATRLGIAPATLTFTAANYATEQVFTFSALEDVDVAVNSVLASIESGTLPPVSINATIADNDTLSISAGVGSLALTEADTPGSGTFTVVLTQQPSTAVTLTVASSDPSAATVSPATLTFTPADYALGASHTLTVTPVSDNNVANEALTIDLGGSGLTTVNVPVNVTDDDVQAIVVSPTSLAINEGGTGAVNISLAFDPEADVTVTVLSADVAAATPSPSTLTFGSNNFGNSQTVTISGEQDADIQNQAVAFTATSAIAPTVAFTVNVMDDDTQAVQLSYAGAPATLTLPEGTAATASTHVVGVRLAFQPAANVTLNIASDNANLTTNTTALTFTPVNFAVEQPFTLTAIDEANIVDESALVTLAAGSLSATLQVDLPDTDIQGFSVTPGTLPTLAEGDATAFDLALNFAPAATVSVTITSNNPKIQVNNSAATTLTIPVSNLNQTVALTALQDNDAVDETGTLTIHDNAGLIADRLLSVSVIDDETMAFEITPVTANTDGQRLEVLEQGAHATFNIRLTAAPTANSLVTITPSATNVIEVSNDGSTFTTSTTLTFTASDFGNKLITVRGLADLNLLDEIFTVAVSGTPALGATDAFVFMQKMEDDAQSIVTAPTAPGPLTITEGGVAVPLAVRLQFQPATTVEITITPNSANVLLNGVSAPQTLLFTTQNYDQLQSVAVTTPQDDDQINPAASSITVTAPALPSRLLNVTFIDEDDQLIILSSAASTLQEPPALPSTGEFTIKLGFVPTAASETITITVPFAQTNKVQVCNTNTLRGSVCGPSTTLTFSNQTGMPGGWDQPQTVFTAAQADIDVNNETVALALNSNRVPNPVATHTLSIVDDDQLNLVILPSQAATLAEGSTGNTATFSVQLNFDPTTPVTVALVSPDLGAVTVAPATLTFDSSNFGMPQTFTVTSALDADVRNELVNIGLTTAGRTPAAAVAITVIDPDQQGLRILDSGLRINEGSNATIRLQLSHQPTSNVVVAISPTVTAQLGQAAQAVSATPASVIFTPSNWNIDHIVTIAAPEDTDLDHATGTIAIAVSSGQVGQERAAPGAATFDVRDNDSQGIIVTLAPGGLINSAQEGGPSAEFKVRLAARPRLAQTDRVQLLAPPLVTFNGNTTLDLFFDDSNFGVDQTVVWNVVDGGAAFTSTIELSIDETADQGAPFGAANISPTSTHAVRAIDDEAVLLSSLEVTTLHGATQFVQRANVAFGFNGSAEGIVAVTGRSLPIGGNASLGFTSRSIGAVSAGPATAVGGVEPTTEIVEFDGDDDGNGPDVAAWNTFTSDATGITYQRFTLAGTVLVAKTVVASAADNATDFSVARNTLTGVYGVIYRRESVSRNNLYFRTVTIATGARSNEQVVTTADTFVHFHPTLMFVGAGNVTTYDSGSGPVAAPYAVIYAANGFNKLVRLTASGGPLGSFTFDQNQFPGNFSSSIFRKEGFLPFVPEFTIAAASVRSVGPGLGDNRVAMHMIGLTSSGTAAQYLGDSLVSNSQMLPISPPAIAFNGVGFAVAFDDGLGGNNGIGVITGNFLGMGFAELRLADVSDSGLFPAITWALDRWVLRYQAEAPDVTGIRMRTGSFKGIVTINEQ